MSVLERVKHSSLWCFFITPVFSLSPSNVRAGNSPTCCLSGLWAGHKGRKGSLFSLLHRTSYRPSQALSSSTEKASKALRWGLFMSCELRQLVLTFAPQRSGVSGIRKAKREKRWLKDRHTAHTVHTASSCLGIRKVALYLCMRHMPLQPVTSLTSQTVTSTDIVWPWPIDWAQS